MHSDLTLREPKDAGDRALGERLRELPRELAPPFDYAALKRRARARGRSLRSRRMRLTALIHGAAAAAAAVAVLILGAALWVQHRAPRAPQLVRSPPLTADWHAAVPEQDAARMGDATLAGEHWLASLPQDPVIVRVGTQLAVTDLEDRIAAVDDLLTAARLQSAPGAPLQTLQYERAQLVDSLVQVRYAQSLAQLP